VGNSPPSFCMFAPPGLENSPCSGQPGQPRHWASLPVAIFVCQSRQLDFSVRKTVPVLSDRCNYLFGYCQVVPTQDGQAGPVHPRYHIFLLSYKFWAPDRLGFFLEDGPFLFFFSLASLFLFSQRVSHFPLEEDPPPSMDPSLHFHCPPPRVLFPPTPPFLCATPAKLDIQFRRPALGCGCFR